MRKIYTFTKPQPRRPQRRPGNALRSAGRGCECHMLRRRTCSPALTCQHFTAKCFPAKCTRALSHSAMVCTGKQATVAAAVRLEYNSRVEEKAGPTLLGAENTTLHILGLMIKKMSLGRKRGREKKEGGQIKVLSLFQQSLVGALRISSERCVVFFLVFFPH